jgi:hypothetical protein
MARCLQFWRAARDDWQIALNQAERKGSESLLNLGDSTAAAGGNAPRDFLRWLAALL